MHRTKIVISPSQQVSNPTVIAEANTEAKLTRLIGEAVYKLLKSDDRLDVCLIPAYDTGNDISNLRKAVQYSNDFIGDGKGFHLDIHSDGGYNGHGASAFYLGDGGKAFVIPIFSELCDMTPWNDMRISQRDNLMVLTQTTASAALIEVSFHDKVEEAYWMFNNIDYIAHGIVRGIYKGVGIEPKKETIAERKFVPQWQKEALKELTECGVIESPEFWDSILGEAPTNGSMIALVNKLRKFLSK